MELVIPDLDEKLKSLPPSNSVTPQPSKPTGPGRATFSVLPPDSTELIGRPRFTCRDPFGNQIELAQIL